MRRLLGLLVLVGGPLWYARRRRDRRGHVHLHFDDGSTVVLAAETPEAARLLALARQAL